MEASLDALTASTTTAGLLCAIRGLRGVLDNESLRGVMKVSKSLRSALGPEVWSKEVSEAFGSLARHVFARHELAQSGAGVLPTAIMTGKPIGPLLARGGLDVNAPAPKGLRAIAELSEISDGPFTPLHLAAFRNDVGAAATLIEHGADLHVKDGEGDPPVNYAAAFGSTEVRGSPRCGGV
jgi:hypothetical protein